MTIFALGADRPDIHPDTWVAHDANLIGKLLLCCSAHPAAVANSFSNMNVNWMFHLCLPVGCVAPIRHDARDPGGEMG